MTYYKHEINKVTTFARVLTTVEFDGKSAHVVASVRGTESDLGVIRVDTEMLPATEAEWDAAVKEMHKLRAKRAKEAAKAKEAKELAERFGLRVAATADRGSTERVLYVTRVTKTSIFTSDGSRWKRSYGSQHGSTNRWSRTILTRSSLDRVKAFVGSRDFVNVIAERQAAGDANHEPAVVKP